MANTPIVKCCPFCGGDAFWRQGDKSVRVNDSVSCYKCFAEIEGTYEPMSALTAWNTRMSNSEDGKKP